MARLFAAVGLGFIIMVVESPSLELKSSGGGVQQITTPVAATGITGKVAAQRGLDALQKIAGRDAQRGKRPRTRKPPSSDAQIEVLETGVSIGEVDWLLHQHRT